MSVHNVLARRGRCLKHSSNRAQEARDATSDDGPVGVVYKITPTTYI
jgi:hypothetical protein